MKSIVWKSENGISIKIIYDNKKANKEIRAMLDRFRFEGAIEVDGAKYALDGFNKGSTTTTFYLVKIEDEDVRYDLTESAEKELEAMGVEKIKDIPEPLLDISIRITYKNEEVKVIPIGVEIGRMLGEENLEFILRAYDFRASKIESFGMKDISEVF